MGKPINDEVILSHWDNEVIRLAASARTGDIKPSAMLNKLGALNLVIAAIVYWNTMYMDKAAQHLLKAGQLADPSLLRHVSPLGWMHINLTGDFVWNSGAAERMNARPLRLFTEKTPMRDDVIGIMETRPALRERRSVADRVIEKIKAFVQTFIEGVD